MSEFEYAQREPSPELAGLIVRLWFLRGPSPRRFERIVPMPFVHVIVNLGEPYRVVRRGDEPVGETLRGAFVSGLQSRYLVNENPAMLHHVGAELRAPGFATITTTPMPQLADRVVDAETVLPEIGALRAELGLHPAPENAIDELESFLRARFDPTAVSPTVERAVAMLASEPWGTVGAIAEHLGISHRVLISQFRQATGTTPKRFSDVHRFHRFLDELPREGELPTWAQLVARSGFYDQPHFIRSFSRFTGMTPRAWFDIVRLHGRDYPSFVPMDEG